MNGFQRRFLVTANVREAVGDLLDLLALDQFVGRLSAALERLHLLCRPASPIRTGSDDYRKFHEHLQA